MVTRYRGTEVLHCAVLAATALLIAGPSPSAAQDPEPEERCICVDDFQEAFEGMAVAFGPRARLGVVLGEPTEVDGRSGVELFDVPGGSPAHAAGIRAGDSVVALDGEDLGPDPRRSLRRAMADRAPSDSVAVTFYRDGAERTLTVVTEEAGPTRGMRVHLDGLRERLERLDHPGMPHGPHGRGGFRAGLELVAVNPELGAFFGTDRGVLVADIEDDSPLDLRTGDVILAIGGRDVRDPRHARAILASYRDDEPFTLRIIRERRETTVTARAREGAGGG